jgi:nicotinate-nucleotide adenylyltransferase
MHQLALFGTSADPPTRGHQLLLEGLLELFPQVVTWASDNPIKSHGAPLELRSQMLAALVADIANPRLQHVQQLSSPWAIDTLRRAAARWPDAELVFVVGSDLAGQIPRWKQADALLAGCRLAIAQRQGWPLAPTQLPALERLGARVALLPLTVPGTASSALRDRPDRQQIPASVWPLLLLHNLYGLAEVP